MVLTHRPRAYQARALPLSYVAMKFKILCSTSSVLITSADSKIESYFVRTTLVYRHQVQLPIVRAVDHKNISLTVVGALHPFTFFGGHAPGGKPHRVPIQLTSFNLYACKQTVFFNNEIITVAVAKRHQDVQPVLKQCRERLSFTDVTFLL